MTVVKDLVESYSPFEELSEECLSSKYEMSCAMQEKIRSVQTVMKASRIKVNTMNTVIRKMLPMLIPPGVKAKIKGDVFNAIVVKELKTIFKRLRLSAKRYRLHVEKKSCHMQEIPDWIVEDVKTKRLLIGYNQLDFWSGGHQTNRGGKYILDENMHKRLRSKGVRVVCVIYNKVPVMNRSSKIYDIVSIGARRRRLTYVNGLVQILSEFVNEKINVMQQSKQRRSLRRRR